MKTYFIFKNESKDKDYKVLDNGFSFFALIFGPFWAIMRGLWVVSILNLSLMAFIQIFSNDYLLPLIFFSNLFWGFLGKDLYIQNLIDSDYRAKKVIAAPSQKKALLIYLSEQT
ncbi:MAG: hypothetical protein CMM95_02615 [Rickettsiales bacterium]|nr:hypothetical protein [Rickettsiales bacterium]|tara:strand:+ start:148 stop:489 length:342 start_codon:yes stop_codon:yes gene_type:complete